MSETENGTESEGAHVGGTQSVASAVPRPAPQWVLKVLAIFVTTAMVLVVFSNPERGRLLRAAAAPDAAPDSSLENARRLTLAKGASASLVLAAGDGTTFLAWLDGRGGPLTVYFKATSDGGHTFTADRRLAAPLDPRNLTIGASGKAVGVGWDAAATVEGRAGRGVFYMFSPDGRRWTEQVLVASGRSPDLKVVTNSTIVITFLQADRSGTIVRSVLVNHTGTEVGTPVSLLGFRANTTGVATVVTGNRVHVVWDELIRGDVALVHMDVDLATRSASTPSLVALFRGAMDRGSLSLLAGPQLQVVWSDDRSGRLRVYAAFSTDGGRSWTPSAALTPASSDARHPSAALNGTGVLRVVWQDLRSGVWQIFSREYSRTGVPAAREQRVSFTRTSARAPALAWQDGAAITVWEDARNGDTELYGDVDAGLTRPDIRTVWMYVKRLPSETFAPPVEQSRASLLESIARAAGLIAAAENRGAARTLRTDIRSRMDGSFGGSPTDDLLLDQEAQLHLVPLVDRLAKDLSPREDQGGVPNRVGNIPPDDPPEPPGPPGEDVVSVVHNVTHIKSTSATISWAFETIVGYTPVVSTWVDYWTYGKASTRVWHNATPYIVVLNNLARGTDYFYKIGGVLRSGRTVWSENATFSTTVQISNLRVEGVTYTSAIIKWDTNVDASGTVYYGATNNYGSTATGGTVGTSHSVSLSGLVAKTTYYFVVESVAREDSTMKTTSGEGTFFTGIGITSSISVQEGHNATDFLYQVSWTTNVAGTSRVDWGADEAYGQIATGANGTLHAVNMVDPPTAETVYFRVLSVSTTDPSDSTNRTGDPFAVPAMTITNWKVSYRAATNVTITWETRMPNGVTPVPSTSVVRYGITENEAYTDTATGANGSYHTVDVRNLVSGTTYHFRIESASLSNPNDVARVSNRSFTTKGIDFTGAFNVVPFARHVLFFWNTTALATSEVQLIRPDYLVGWVTAYGDSGTAHAVNATGLLPLTGYQYTITSTSLSNANDSVYWTGTITTNYEPNDANSGQDAPGTLAAALQIVPGRFTGQLEPGVDTSDFLKLWVRPGQLIRASMQPPSTHDFDLYLHDPSGNLADSSTNPGSAVETVQVLAAAEGFWAVKIAYVSGTNYGVWQLELNLTGGDLDQFFLDVGKPGDGDANAHLPGMSLDLSANWSNPANSSANSTATWDQLFAPPDYRQASTNATFFLNLYNYTYQRYTDYLVTIQYYSTADVNVSVYNGGGWAVLAMLSGKSNWWTISFRVESTHLADAQSDILGMNVAFRFSGTVQVDRISAVAYGYRTYVGHGSDDKDDWVHVPGAMLVAGWQDDGMPYKNATAYADFLLTIPSPDIAYMLTFDFNATGRPVWIEQWNGSAWVKIGRLGTASGSARVSTDTRFYFDSSVTLPGINVDLRFTAPVWEVTSIAVTWSGFQDDIGDGDDGNLTVHDPGVTILVHPLNQEWGAPQVDSSGRTFRQGTSFSDFYLTSPLPGADYPLAITYKATLPGAVQQWDGTQWHVIGTLTGDSAWHTVYATARHDWFSDWYGNGNLNARFEFTVPVALDALVAFPDQDLDLLSDFQETYGYAYVNNTQFQMGINAISYTHYVVFNAAGPGRYTFEIDSSAFSSKLWIDVDDIRRGEVSGSWDGVTYVNATVCGNGHVLALWLVYGLVTVRSVRFARDATGPTSLDTDSDGLTDWTEACDMERFRFGSDEFATNVNFRLYPTDPLAPDTDFDGLTDFQELFSYHYSDTTTRQVTPTANYTLNVTLPDQGFFDIAMTLRGYPPTGKSVTALVFANGLPVWQYTGSGQWIRTATFSTRLVKGQNALRVSVGEASGWVNLTSVSIAKNGSLTSPTTWDTDGDRLGDGAEESGATGWVLNPVNPDTDGDGVYDGTEVTVLHTDPTNPDTDGDGVGDFEDMYPLSDVVVQITLGNLVITDPNYRYPTTKYYATAGIEGQWVFTKNMSSLSFNLTHTLTVNTRDSALVANYNITVRRNDRALVDITPDTLTTELRAQWLYLDESKCYQTSGGPGSSLRATLNYCVKTIKVGKVNTLLIVPTDYSTIFNGSTGMHRYVGEQKFVFVVLNVSGSNAYFGTGMNEIIVPRGIYFSTRFHKLLNDTWSNVSSSALVGSEVIGNDDNNTRSLNAKVVQMIVSHNVTAAKAKELLDLLLVNVSGGRLARYTNVTGEFYTMGFVKRVVDLTPYVSVYNTGNYSPPAPPPPPTQTSFWSVFWNTIAGAVQYLWNAVQAIAVYICNVVAAVANWAMRVAEAFVEAAYQAIKAVVEAVVQAILAVVRFIMEFIKAALDVLVTPIVDAYDGWMSGAQASFNDMFSHHSDPIGLSNPLGGLRLWWSYITSGYFFLGLFAVWMGLNALAFIEAPFSSFLEVFGPVVTVLILNTLVQFAKSLALTIVATALAGAAVEAILYFAIPQSDPFWREAWATTLMGLVSSIGMLWIDIQAKEPLRGDFVGLLLAVLALGLTAAAASDNNVYFGVKGSVIWSILSVLAAVGSIYLTRGTDLVDLIGGPLAQIEEVMGVVSLVFGLTSLAVAMSG